MHPVIKVHSPSSLYAREKSERGKGTKNRICPLDHPLPRNSLSLLPPETVPFTKHVSHVFSSAIPPNTNPLRFNQVLSSSCRIIDSSSLQSSHANFHLHKHESSTSLTILSCFSHPSIISSACQRCNHLPRRSLSVTVKARNEYRH